MNKPANVKDMMGKATKGQDDEDEASPFNEEGLTQVFVDRHGTDFRHIAEWGQWYHWTGKCWERETTLKAFDLARAVCRDTAKQFNSAKAKGKISKAQVYAAIERIAKSDRAIAATVDQWDTDIFLLNTPGGSVDLRTGAMREHRREDYCTKITAVSPGGECPQWLEFLKTTFNGDAELIAYIQKVLGYCLTGDIRLQILFFGHGQGGNGKGVLISVMQYILDEYAKTADEDLFTVTNTTQHLNVVARLKGARLVVCSEVEAGKRWAESKIKKMTGGDKQTANFMRQDTFEFIPEFKLFIIGNDPPSLYQVDEAIRRRLHLIPFTAKISEDKKDVHLVTKLKTEAGGILKWLIEGCVKQVEEGITKPASVANATDEYLEAEDTVQLFLNDCFEFGVDRKESSKNIFYAWRGWAESSNEKVGSARALGLKLTKHGFALGEVAYGDRGRFGLELKTDRKPPVYNGEGPPS